MTTRSDPAPRLGTADLLRRFLRDRGDEAFYVELAKRAIESLPRPVDTQRVLDLGCGPGHYAVALADAGADVIATDLDAAELTPRAGIATFPSDARCLPLPDACMDGVFCSNMLEHTPQPFAVIDEIARVLRPGGWGYISWTNWYSPWGGHAIAPFHYLGAERGERVYRKVFGPPRGKNLPHAGVWPTSIGATVAYVRAHQALDLDDVVPRYYPWAKIVMRVPAVREVLAWNCLLHVTRRDVH